MKEPRILPFYMTYPMLMAYSDDKDMIQDLEYFQQIYPVGARKLQREIVKAISIIDYDGSMIYDEYPDRFMMSKLAKDILDRLKRQADTNSEELNALLRLDFIEEYVLILLLNEVFKRRHKSNRGYLQF